MLDHYDDYLAKCCSSQPRFDLSSLNKDNHEHSLFFYSTVVLREAIWSIQVLVKLLNVATNTLNVTLQPASGTRRCNVTVDYILQCMHKNWSILHAMITVD